MFSFTRRRVGAAAITTVLVVGSAVGVTAASDQEGDWLGDAPPGQQISDDVGGVPWFPTEEGAGDELLVTDGSTLDETILTKYIPASDMTPLLGAGANADLVSNASGCLAPAAGSGGSATNVLGGV